jgi:hypothetical protein
MDVDWRNRFFARRLASFAGAGEKSQDGGATIAHTMILQNLVLPGKWLGGIRKLRDKEIF